MGYMIIFIVVQQIYRRVYDLSPWMMLLFPRGMKWNVEGASHFENGQLIIVLD